VVNPGGWHLVGWVRAFALLLLCVHAEVAVEGGDVYTYVGWPATCICSGPRLRLCDSAGMCACWTRHPNLTYYAGTGGITVRTVEYQQVCIGLMWCTQFLGDAVPSLEAGGGGMPHLPA
jgi:hypothetical protein